MVLATIVYNEAARIEGMLDSCLGVVTAVMAVDQSSTDETVGVLTRWCEKNSLPLYLMAEPNRGFSEASRPTLESVIRNSGIAVDWVLFLDADERLGPELKQVLLNWPDPPVNGCYIRRRNQFLSPSDKLLGETIEDNQLRLLRWPWCAQSTDLHTTFIASPHFLIQEEMLHVKSLPELEDDVSRYNRLRPGYSRQWNSQWPDEWFRVGVDEAIRRAKEA